MIFWKKPISVGSLRLTNNYVHLVCGLSSSKTAEEMYAMITSVQRIWTDVGAPRSRDIHLLPGSVDTQI